MAAATQPYASASLYVGDLAPDVTEALLFEVFKAIGPVASIRVCRDSLTRRSLGYAYVNFHNVGDAERAVNELNYTRIADRPCRIMWSHRDPAKRKSGVGNIFIKNLDKSIDNTALYDTFGNFGRILSCKVETDQNGVSKGYGYVHYETQEEADQAIAKVNGMLLADKKVFVGHFQPKKDRSTVESKQKYTNVYIKDLDTAFTSEQLEQKFGEFGKVTSAVVMSNDKGESKGFGFINFEKPEDAHKAVEALNGSAINGKTVYVGRAQKKSEREEELRHARMDQLQKYQGVNVYVKNLDDSVDDERVRLEFSKFGTITSAKVMRDEKGNSRGFGFVCFSNPEEATRAVTDMNGTLLVSKPLYVGLAQRKDIRRAQLEALHNQKLSQMRMAPPGVMPPMYPGAQPIFFQPGMPQPRMMYQQMVPRQTRFNNPGPGGQPGGQPGQPGGGAGAGAGGPRGGQGGFQGGPQQAGMVGGGAPYGGGPGGAPMGGPRGGQQPRGQRPPRGGQQGPAQGGQPQGGPQGVPVNAAQLNGKQQGRGPQAPPNAGARGFKYNNNVRNQGGAAPVPGQNMPPPQAYPQPAGIQTTPEQLEQQVGSEESKQMIGEQLYSFIIKAQPENAGKITGMLLESLDLRELLHLLQNRPALDGKVAEAVTVLEEQARAEETA